jgi:hypothetical protein
MAYTYLPQTIYLQLNGDLIELIHDGEVIASMTPEDARSNAADLIDAADKAEGKGHWAK